MTVIVQRGARDRHRSANTSDEPPRRRPARFRRRQTTPEKLRLVQVLLVSACVLSGVGGAVSLQGRVDATREIEDRTAPLTADAVDVYRALANADTTVASEFLSGAASAPASKYDEDIDEAARGLARAATLTPRQSLTADRIADIAAQLPVYTALVERARAAQGTPEQRVSLVRSASSLMQSSILRRAEAFQRIESERLDAQYRRARSLPAVALAVGAVSVLALLGTQVMMARRTRRILSVGLASASVAVLTLALWWAVYLSTAGDHLANSRRRSQTISDALGPAQIAARQARASEILALVARDADLYEPDFSARMQRLARQDGEGGALGAARRLASDDAGRATVTESVNDTRAWRAAHAQVAQLQKAGRHPEAIALAVGRDAPTTAAFTAIDDRLARGVTNERTAFATDIEQAQDALSGLVPGTVLIMVAGAGAAAWGIGQRLREYR